MYITIHRKRQEELCLNFFSNLYMFVNLFRVSINISRILSVSLIGQTNVAKDEITYYKHFGPFYSLPHNFWRI